MSSPPLLFLGDPHGDFDSLRWLHLQYPSPGTMVISGDLELRKPAQKQFSELIGRGWDVRAILGNHDCTTPEQLLYLIGPAGLPCGVLSGVTELCGVRVAALGGVFRGGVFRPGTPARWNSRAEWMAHNPQRWRGGPPHFLYDSIFPEDDLIPLGDKKADVLVCHEAPSSHPYGFHEIDLLAELLGARWILHGHHHRSYTATLPSGIKVRGLAKWEIWQFPDDA